MILILFYILMNTKVMNQHYKCKNKNDKRDIMIQLRSHFKRFDIKYQNVWYFFVFKIIWTKITTLGNNSV